MLREFVLRLVKRTAVLLPCVAVLILLSSGPSWAKLVGLSGLPILPFLVQMGELAVFTHNGRDRQPYAENSDPAPSTSRQLRERGS